MKTINNRTTEYPIDDIFLKRYSPRAMSEETISKDELMTLFDALIGRRLLTMLNLGDSSMPCVTRQSLINYFLSDRFQ